MNITLNYSDKSFVVSGSTKEFKEQLMALGGRYNPNLKTGPGYIFSNKKEQEVTEFVNMQNNSNTNVNINQQNNQSKTDILSLDNKKPNVKYQIIKKDTTIKSSLPSMYSSIQYPNRFVGSDGLSYQIIIETCILPYINQKVQVKYDGNEFEATVSELNNISPINDITLSYQEDNIEKKTKAIIMNGKWQIHLFSVVHELIFQ